jgi:hypothetical protein
MPARLSVSVFALVVATCAFTPSAFAMPEATVTAAATPASVIVFDQKLDSPEVKVSYIFAPEKSFAVVHQGDEKSEGAKKLLGTLALDAGDHRDLKIPLSNPAKSGDGLWISLYRAKGGGAEFNSETDVSYWADQGLPSTHGFVVQ